MPGDALEQTAHYIQLLKMANQKMKDLLTEDAAIASLHFEDSWQLSACIPKNARVIDIGTGAGFPGMALALVRPDLQVTLVDATLKKIKFLKDVIEQLRLDQVTAVQGRAEELGRLPAFREQFDLAVARAVTTLPILLELCLPFVKSGGKLIAMKGEDDEKESAKRAMALLGGTPDPLVTYRLPGLNRPRSLVLIRKTGPTPPSFPRRMAVIRKRPL